MGKSNFLKKVILMAVLFLFFFNLSPETEASSFQFKKNWNENHSFKNALQKLCAVRIKINQKFPKFPVPKICKYQEEKPPSLEFYAEPVSIKEGEKATLYWASENSLSCEATGGWTGEKTLSGSEEVYPTQNTTYTLSCDGVEEGIEKSVLVEVEILPPPPTDVCPNIEGVQESVPAGYHKEGDDCILDTSPTPTLNHIIISEVYYDVDLNHGSGSSYEWVELYNNTGSAVDISGWTIGDAGSPASDVIPLETIIPNGNFVVITGSAEVATLWSIPAEKIILISGYIGGGLSDGGDAVFLKNNGTDVDSMSYGSNTSVFYLPLPAGSTDGHSFRRKNLIEDTDGPNDWEDLVNPTPGSF